MLIPSKWINKVLPQQVKPIEFLSRIAALVKATQDYDNPPFVLKSPAGLINLVFTDLLVEFNRLQKDKSVEFYVYNVFYDIGFLVLKTSGLELHLKNGNLRVDDGIYIEYLGTHIGQIDAGTNLQEFTVNRSQELGFGGIVYLCSVPGAVGFYKKLGYVELGCSGENNQEIYMKLTPNATTLWKKLNGTWEYCAPRQPDQPIRPPGFKMAKL